jgi:hypothetical protein
MISYSNLPPDQRLTQKCVDQFNADERLWKQLASSRKLRRKLLRGWSKAKLKQLDLVEFSDARPPEDCIGKLVAR